MPALRLVDQQRGTGKVGCSLVDEFGLGQAIAQSFVEGWGGTIYMESEPGRGGTVVVRLHPVRE